MIGVVEVPVERYSERKGGLCSEVTNSIDGGARGGPLSTMSGSSINVLRYCRQESPSREQQGGNCLASVER